nr:fibrous sheath CABYR-binding protein [Zootoca vivipara]
MDEPEETLESSDANEGGLDTEGQEDNDGIKEEINEEIGEINEEDAHEINEENKQCDEIKDSEEEKHNDEIEDLTQHQESGDTGLAMDQDAPKTPSSDKGEVERPESKISIIQHKELIEENQQPDLPPGSVSASMSSLKKELGHDSRRGSQHSQHQPGHESRRGSQSQPLIGQESRHSQQQPGQESRRGSQPAGGQESRHSQQQPGQESRRGSKPLGGQESRHSQKLPGHESHRGSQQLTGQESRHSQKLPGHESRQGSQQIPGHESRRGSQPVVGQESRHSQPVPGHESRRGSHQSISHQVLQSHKPSITQPMNEVETKEDMTWISQRTGKVMKCESQQTSRIWEHKPLAAILQSAGYPKSVEKAAEQPAGKPTEDGSWISKKTGKLLKCTGQQTSKIWERKPLAEVLRLSQQPDADSDAGEKVKTAEEVIAAPKDSEAKPEEVAEAQLSSHEVEKSQQGDQEVEGKKKSLNKMSVDKTLQTDSKISIFRHKELVDKHEQTDFPPDTLPSSGTSLKKQAEGQGSRRGSQQVERKKSQHESQQPEGQELMDESQQPDAQGSQQPTVQESRRSSQQPQQPDENKPAQLENEQVQPEDHQKLPEEETFYLDRRSGIEVRYASQQTSESLFIDYLTKIYGPRYGEAPGPVDDQPKAKEDQPPESDEIQGEAKVEEEEKQEPVPGGGDEAEAEVQQPPQLEAQEPQDTELQTSGQQPEGPGSRKESQQAEMPGSRKESQQVEGPGSRKESQQVEGPGSRKESQQAEAPVSRKESQQDEMPGFPKEKSQQEEMPGSRKDSQQVEMPGFLKESQQEEMPGSRKDSQQVEMPGSRKDSQQVEMPGFPKDTQQVEMPGSRKESQLFAQHESQLHTHLSVDEVTEQPGPSESQGTLGSIVSFTEGEDVALQTYSIVSLPDGIWLNRKTGKFLVSQCQQTAVTSLSALNQIALEEAAIASKPSGLGAGGEGVVAKALEVQQDSATAEAKPEEDQPPPLSQESRRASQQSRHSQGSRRGSQIPVEEEPSPVNQPASDDQKEEEPQEAEDAEKAPSHRLSEAALESAAAADREDNVSQRTYSSISLAKGSFVNKRTGRSLISQQLQTEESSFHNPGEAVEAPRDGDQVPEEDQVENPEPSEPENPGE